LRQDAVRFFLGTHEPRWLERVDVPLFVSHRRFDRCWTDLPRARTAWALDSGGFTELNTAGHWRTSVDEYLERVERLADEVGGLEWAAPMDWMCEPAVLAETGLTIEEHQHRTVANYLELRDRGPFIPVLQGWELTDYLHCIELYHDAGVALTREPLVGLGTVCRRHDTHEIALVVRELTGCGLSLHGFGMKSRGVRRVGDLLTSADSMAWSSRGRFAWQHDHERLCGGQHAGGCANCERWALRWRHGVVDGLGLFA
jgi:hypothetical protein